MIFFIYNINIIKSKLHIHNDKNYKKKIRYIQMYCVCSLLLPKLYLHEEFIAHSFIDNTSKVQHTYFGLTFVLQKIS